MKRIIITTLSLLCGFTLLAQKNFVDGYIITQDGDSLIGKIDLRSSTKNYQSCMFEKGDVTEYLPADILGYGFSGGKYYTSQALENVFVEVIISGELSLYKYKSSLYIQKKDGSVDRLDYTLEEEEKADWRTEKATKSNTEWHRIFASAIADCYDDPSKTVAPLKLTEKELTAAVIDYNNCRNLPYTVYKQNKEGVKFNFGLMAGYTFATLKAEAGNFPILSRHLAEEYTSQFPFFGGSVNISSPKISETLSFQQDILYSQTSFSSIVETDVTSRDEVHTVDIDLTMISLPFSIKYQSTGQSISYFFQAGGNIELLSGSDTSLETVITNPDNTTETRSAEALGLKSGAFGPWFGLGVAKHFNSFTTELNLRISSLKPLNDGDPQFGGVKTKLTRSQIGLRVYLN